MCPTERGARIWSGCARAPRRCPAGRWSQHWSEWPRWPASAWGRSHWTRCPATLVELARWGMAGKAPALRRHPYSRKLATLLATVVHLEAKATDDALELFDVLMTNELTSRAVREANRENLRRYPHVSRDAATCAAAVAGAAGVVRVGRGDHPGGALEGDRGRGVALGPAVRGRQPCCRLLPPDADRAGRWRVGLVERYAVVRQFVPRLCRTIDFGATAEAAAVLDALRKLPELLEARAPSRFPPGTSTPAGWRWTWCGGLVAAAGVQRRPARGHRPPRCVRVLRAGAVPPSPSAAGHLRHRLDAVGRPRAKLLSGPRGRLPGHRC